MDLFLGAEQEAVGSVGPDDKAVCAMAQRRGCFASESGVTVLRLLSQLPGATSWTIPGSMARPSGCCSLALEAHGPAHMSVSAQDTER